MSTSTPAPVRLLPQGGLREFVQLAAEAFAVGLVASLVLLLAALAIASRAEATAPATPKAGALLFRTADGSVPAPLVATAVEIRVAGIIARTRVTQRFVNPGADWREGVYVFPLPETAAVDRLEMRVGERLVEGQIRERDAARATYEQAQREGRKAALVEQERPNVFTTSVAPIGPDEDVVVTIEYQHSLHYDQGTFSLRFPMAMTPRYIPGTPGDAAAVGSGWAQDTDGVPDASRITPPVVPPAAGKVLPVTLMVELDAGFPLAKLASSYHRVRVEEAPGRRHRVVLADGPVPADRDFELTWAPEVGAAPGAAVFGEAGAAGAHALVMLLPGLPATAGPRPPREVTFVIDTSGSMAGTAIAQARAALLLALERLAPGDRFNVIEFNSRSRTLFAVPLPVDPATIGRARSFVQGLRADGGTEMREALALAFAAPSAPGLVRQVVFLTDGAVGNEDELFRLIRDRLGDRRLFTVGIGSAPNSHFMARAAQFGRGSATSIGDLAEVQAKMSALFRKLESPALTDIAISWPAGSEASTTQVPDLYAGEPIVATAALPALAGEIVVTGTHAGTPWQARLPLAGHGDAPGVGALWARARIDALLDRQQEGADADAIRADVVRVALAHHLVSRYTSLVAVDVTPSAPAGVAARRSAVAGNLPEGQVHEAIFGGLPQTATPALLQALLGGAALLLAAALMRLGRRDAPGR